MFTLRESVDLQSRMSKSDIKTNINRHLNEFTVARGERKRGKINLNKWICNKLHFVCGTVELIVFGGSNQSGIKLRFLESRESVNSNRLCQVIIQKIRNISQMCSSFTPYWFPSPCVFKERELYLKSSKRSSHSPDVFIGIWLLRLLHHRWNTLERWYF